MRTTLELDDDLVESAKRIARPEGRTLGEVISDWARRSIAVEGTEEVRNGVRLFRPRKGTTADIRIVNELRDE